MDTINLCAFGSEYPSICIHNKKKKEIGEIIPLRDLNRDGGTLGGAKEEKKKEEDGLLDEFQKDMMCALRFSFELTMWRDHAQSRVLRLLRASALSPNS